MEGSACTVTTGTTGSGGGRGGSAGRSCMASGMGWVDDTPCWRRPEAVVRANAGGNNSAKVPVTDGGGSGTAGVVGGGGGHTGTWGTLGVSQKPAPDCGTDRRVP